MAEPALSAARAALSGAPAWLVGGAIRDRALGRTTADLDVVVDGDPAEAARAIARAAGRAACFALSEEFGAWRVSARDSSWQVDVERLREGTLEADLALRDFTVNAIAEPIGGGAAIDPLGGLADLAAGRLRMTAPGAFADDPLRVLRLARIAVELDLEPDEQTLGSAREHVDELRRCSPERVFAELRRIVAAEQALRGLQLMEALSATAVVLPELDALRDVEQNRFHHADVYGHTLEVLARTIALTEAVAKPPPGGGEIEPAVESTVGAHRAALAALLAMPLADGMTRGEALRWGALLHDAAKPLTRDVRPADGRVTFIGHDERGAALARDVLERLRCSERLRAHVAALVRHHLRLGFLVHESQPLQRRTVFGYLRACSPVEVDVTLLSVADRLATRGDRAQESIDAHLAVARQMLPEALRWRADGPPAPLLRGDELARELGIATGPRVGELLAALSEAQFTGEVATREQAVAHARALV
ncbi:MAG TPA: HD domain-containing protein [Solirubrobacteraceae bacterium]|jgi:putative nucleotidyltransferase with HDIG domain|nr:HD domain-containing protein [Solirubrobacteraceae bacterium]